MRQRRTREEPKATALLRALAEIGAGDKTDGGAKQYRACKDPDSGTHSSPNQHRLAGTRF
jgi:hypothetical protein